jgi:peptidoglycan/xylan/chitin deacetylase (PgdA/CDA1 family)
VDREGRDQPIADIMRVPGPEKWQVLADKGAPTFLLLEDGVAGGPASPARPDAEGAALGALAEEVYRGLSRAERDAWPGGVALALQMLADRSFFPPAVSPVGARHEEGGVFRALAEGRYVRVVNFHATPRRVAGGFEEQMTKLAENFAPVSHDDLMGLVARGEWPHDRPGVVISFFDGFRDNYEVAATTLDRLGLIGWFFLISGWISSRPEDQRAFADSHLMNLPCDDRDLPHDGRLALSPEEIEHLARRGHVIASHTHDHTTVSPAFDPDLSPEALAREVAGSKKILESLAGGPVRALAWREGTPLGADRRADAALATAGYELLFANHAVQQILRPPAGRG